MKLALYVCLKNICEGVGGQDESNGTPLYPPLFWLDNIFKILTTMRINEDYMTGRLYRENYLFSHIHCVSDTLTAQYAPSSSAPIS